MAETSCNDLFKNTIQKTILSEGAEEVNVLHISDLHFGIGQNDTEKALFRTQRSDLIKNLIHQLCEHSDKYGNWKPNIVVVSGDIAFKAKPEEYQQFIEDFYELLTDKKQNPSTDDKAFAIEKDCIILCPGNHDVMRDVYAAETDAATLNAYCRPAIPEINSAIGSELGGIPNDYKKIFFEHFNKKDTPKAKPFKSYTDVCCDADPNNLVRLCIPQKWPWVHFATLNSAWDSRDDEDEGRLRVGLDLYKTLYNEHRAIKQNVDGSILCVVFHHPIDGIVDDRPDGGRRVYNWLVSSERNSIKDHASCFFGYVRDTSKCIMNGHIHEARSMRYLGNGGQTAAWSVCGSTLSREKPVYHCRVIKFRRGKSMVHYCDCLSMDDDSDCGWTLTSKPVSPADEEQFKNEMSRFEAFNRVNCVVKTDTLGNHFIEMYYMGELVEIITAVSISLNSVDMELVDVEKQELEQEQEQVKTLVRKKTGE